MVIVAGGAGASDDIVISIRPPPLLWWAFGYSYCTTDPLPRCVVHSTRIVKFLRWREEERGMILRRDDGQTDKRNVCRLPHIPTISLT